VPPAAGSGHPGGEAVGTNPELVRQVEALRAALEAERPRWQSDAAREAIDDAHRALDWLVSCIADINDEPFAE
jgi:hypothetical protein